ncbi:MAG: endonuclease III domain-containing protein [Candidatus Omnitrophica bacterium]|nr:endonuclease III domain-containing protein [Candidatus Omnitrophota bacterium]
MNRPKNTVQLFYRRLFEHFGPQHWWPGETPFEVAVGAILTQNTAWTNAAKAIAGLKQAGLLDPKVLDRVSLDRLAGCIHSAGFFNQKAERLKRFVRYLHRKAGGRIESLRKIPAGQVRSELLALSGIGPETADSILLYALDKPVFVVDAYTRRIFSRHCLVDRETSYDQLQRFFYENLPHQRALFNEYHALLVALGKGFCHKSRPLCSQCPARNLGRLRLEAGVIAR